MKRKLVVIGILICLIIALSGCKYTKTEKYSEKELNKVKKTYEKYLEETYPDQEFTVEVWQDYKEITGGAGLPDFEGYVIRHVVTDSKGNHFRIYQQDTNSYTDHYQEVLDGKRYYNEKGQRGYLQEDGTMRYETDY